MIKLESLCREFIALTAGRADPHAHGKLALAIAAGNLSAAWPRARNIVNGIGSASAAGFSPDETRRLGELLTEIETEWTRQRGRS
jgi:hypothetical protein